MDQQRMKEIVCDAGFCDMSKLGVFVPMKVGMTNHSFLFSYGESRYILRLPGEGTEQIINRKQEWEVYAAVAPTNICDTISYFNPKTGIKITEYLPTARVCNDRDPREMQLCMEKLRSFHEYRLKVAHEFDYWEKMDYYGKLREESCFDDYEATKSGVLSLKRYVDAQPKEKILCHIDSVADNFLFCPNTENGFDIKIIDWEYAAMQDPHFDIAMYAIYSMYDREHIEKLISFYFPEGCAEAIRLKIYCYIAIGGLLWSNWCEYKRKCGLELGEYAQWQYFYAKEYTRIFKEEYKKIYGEQYE